MVVSTSDAGALAPLGKVKRMTPPLPPPPSLGGTVGTMPRPCAPLPPATESVPVPVSCHAVMWMAPPEPAPAHAAEGGRVEAVRFDGAVDGHRCGQELDHAASRRAVVRRLRDVGRPARAPDRQHEGRRVEHLGAAERAAEHGARAAAGGLAAAGEPVGEVAASASGFAGAQTLLASASGYLGEPVTPFDALGAGPGGVDDRALLDDDRRGPDFSAARRRCRSRPGGP